MGQDQWPQRFRHLAARHAIRQLSRPPLASDGCVVLSNPDLHKLYESVEIGKTPVVIADHVDFVDEDKWASDRGLATKLLESGGATWKA